MKNTSEKIVLVDDAPDTLEVLKRNLTEKGYEVVTFLNANAAIKYLKKEVADLVITDYKMPGATGFDLIKFVHDNLKDTETVMITGYPSIEGAVKAMKTGAEEYLSKPFTDEELFNAVERALIKLKLKKMSKSEFSDTDNHFFNVRGSSPGIKKVFRLINKAAQCEKTVLITGKSGSEITQTAYSIHYLSKRKHANLIRFSFSETPEKFVSKQLFGGTGTDRCIFNLCGNGTLFLEDIEYASIEVQKRITKIIKSKSYQDIYSKKPTETNLRIIASSSSNLIDKIKEGKFREPLFTAISQINIEIPPLKERPEDIMFLIKFYFEKFKSELGKPHLELSGRAVNVLEAHDYPGNVDEMKLLIKAIILNADEMVIDAPDLPSMVRYSEIPEPNFTRTLLDVEKHYIKGVLHIVNQNKSRASKILGVDRKTIREKLKI